MTTTFASVTERFRFAASPYIYLVHRTFLEMGTVVMRTLHWHDPTPLHETSAESSTWARTARQGRCYDYLNSSTVIYVLSHVLQKENFTRPSIHQLDM